jgi:hypothetical protein
MSYVIDSVVASAFDGVGKIASHHDQPFFSAPHTPNFRLLS